MDRKLFLAGIGLLLLALPAGAFLTFGFRPGTPVEPWPVDVAIVFGFPLQVLLGGYVMIQGLWPRCVRP